MKLCGEDSASKQVASTSLIDPWFVEQMSEIVDRRKDLESRGFSIESLRGAKRLGFSDRQLAYLWGMSEDEVRKRRLEAGIRTTFKTVDTCAAEFEAHTPYMYGTFEDEDEVPPASKPRVVVLGSGPNRIGQGIEFDYCCVHASFALQSAGYETVMVNCNPETVSTDYDTSDRLYFEPLTIEDVMAVVDAEQPEAVIVQLGGQTPLNLAKELERRGVPIAGTSPASIEAAEDREQFSALCRRLGIKLPPHGTAHSALDAGEVVDRVGLPVVIRPSFVLGGRKMRVIYSYDELSEYLTDLYGSAADSDLTEAPLLIDRFLEAATEVDVDAIFDGHELLVGGIMEHVEEAGVHSGDSACVTPPPTLSEEASKQIMAAVEELARALEVRGLINIQFAVKGNEAFVLEANPRGSRTVPFISKASGIPLAKVAARVMMGATLEQLRPEGVLTEPGAQGLRGGQGSGAALGSLPRRGHRARARDALDRRGHGHRPRCRSCLRQSPAGRRSRPSDRAERSSCRWPIATSRWGWRPPRPSPCSGSSCSRPGEPPVSCPTTPSRRTSSTRSGRDPTTAGIGSRPGRSTWSSTPPGADGPAGTGG